MIRIFDIAQKDLLQLLRDRRTFLFALIMPVVFTLLFGYAFGGFGGEGDPRLPVGFQDEDDSLASRKLYKLLSVSEVLRLEASRGLAHGELEALMADEKLAAAIIVPAGYGHDLLNGKPARLILFADTGTPSGTSIESEILSKIIRLESALRIARIMEQATPNQTKFAFTMDKALSAWEEPPIQVAETTSAAIQVRKDGNESLAHTSPGMMMQFAIAGLLTSAQIMVSERKSRALQRLLTTATRRSHILLGHYLAIFTLIFCQFLALTGFGQLILGLNYYNMPQATLMVAACAALCVAALGLLIGTLARTEEQAIIFSLILMFVLSGLGGAWVPLEVAGPLFQTIGYFSPTAWAMDGFKNVLLRGLGVEAALLPCAALLGYALLFFVLATWKLARSEGK